LTVLKRVMRRLSSPLFRIFNAQEMPISGPWPWQGVSDDCKDEREFEDRLIQAKWRFAHRFTLPRKRDQRRTSQVVGLASRAALGAFVPIACIIGIVWNLIEAAR
jgi:hypothetical protein